MHVRHLVVTGARLAEDADDEQAGREDDGRADDADEELAERKLEWTQRQRLTMSTSKAHAVNQDT